MDNKVVLMYPNFDWTESIERTKWLTHPHNIGLLAAMIEDRYDVSIIDANMGGFSKNDFENFIKDTKPNILGISVATNEYSKSGLIAAGIAKQTNKQIKTIIGGVGAISDPYYFIKNKDVDYVCVGEGEYVLSELCDFLEGKGKFPQTGLLYKEHNQIKGGQKRPFIKNLDELPLPAYHLMNLNKYSTQAQRDSVDHPRAIPYARLTTSRGCPHNCCFCEVKNISGKKPRLRSVENICKEIEFLIENYDIKSLTFDDDNLTTNRKRAKKFFRTMIDRKYNLKWNGPATALFTLDEEMISLMKGSGCEYLGIAIESGNERVLKNIIHKPLNLKKARKTIGKIKEYKIDLAANFIMGFPGETWEEIRETLKFAEEINIDYVRLFIATPLPNTELYDMAKDGGYLKKGFSFDKHLWTDGWIDTPEFRHQDLRILRAYEWDRINFSKPEKRKKIARMMDVTEERLDEIRKDTLKTANP